MKSKIFKYISGLSVLGIFICNSCSLFNADYADEIMKNPKMQEQIYRIILNDSNYLSKFVDKMEADQKGKKSIMNKSIMLKLVLLSDKMDSLLLMDRDMHELMIQRLIRRMEADTITCSRIYNVMMEKESFKSEHESNTKKQLNIK